VDLERDTAGAGYRDMGMTGLRMETAELIDPESFFEIGLEALARLGLITVIESAGEVWPLGGAAIFLGVVSLDLVIEREEVMWLEGCMVAAALVIDMLGFVGLVSNW